MAWITPPSFADGSDLLASDLNTIAGDLAYIAKILFLVFIVIFLFSLVTALGKKK